MSKDHGQGAYGNKAEGRLKIDHQIRNKWLDTDDGLQALWRKSGMTRDDFIQHNQDVIDKVITEHSGNPRED